MRIMIVAGEASGELHGAGVVRALKGRHPACEVFGVGGNRMRAAGCELVYPIERFAFMGLVEVVRHLPFIRSALRRLERLFQERRPDVLILIDYPDFNLRLARIARRYGIPVLYYISPQVWAWRPGRIHTIVRLVDRMAVVFPFEVDLYEKAGGAVEFVGHPLLEGLETRYDKPDFCRQAGLDPARPIVGLLPGSRWQEVSRLLPAMAATIERMRISMPGVQGVIGLAPTIRREALTPLLDGHPALPVVEGLTCDVMRHADLLLVASGTATLESACFGTPLFVLYRMARLSWWIARRMVTIPDIGLVNVVAGRRIVPEFLQDRVDPRILAPEALALLSDPERLARMRADLRTVRSRLGTPGASERVAEMAERLMRPPA
jgi:lipid-A-disaccharide synthase